MSILLGGCLSVVGPLLLYLLTTPSTVVFGDSGELITAACTLGIPHPPGFPLYVLVGKLFCSLPVGTAAFRLNLMSGVFGALTCGLLFCLLRELKIHWLAALGAAWALSTSKLFWSVAILAEVYTLQTALLGLLFWLGLRYRNGGRPFIRNTFFCCLGLALANHWPLLVLALPALLCLVWRPLQNEGISRWARGLPFIVVGLIPYLYLPLRSLAQPPIDWNHPHTVANFLLHVLRWNTSETAEGWLIDDSLKLLRLFGWQVLGRDFGWVGFLAALWGLHTFWSRDRALVLATIVGWVCSTVCIVAWVRIPWSGPFIFSVMVTFAQSSLFLAIGVGCALQAIVEWLAPSPSPSVARPSV